MASISYNGNMIDPLAQDENQFDQILDQVLIEAKLWIGGNHELSVALSLDATFTHSLAEEGTRQLFHSC